jgi:hypothetical protein
VEQKTIRRLIIKQQTNQPNQQAIDHPTNRDQSPINQSAVSDNHLTFKHLESLFWQINDFSSI